MPFALGRSFPAQGNLCHKERSFYQLCSESIAENRLLALDGVIGVDPFGIGDAGLTTTRFGTGWGLPEINLVEVIEAIG